MPAFSRRHVLRAFGAATLLYLLRPFHAGAGVLDRLFGHQSRKATTPITPNEEFYVTSYRSPPTIRLHDWSLSLKGLIEQPVTLTYEQLIEKSAVSRIATLECVGNTIGGEFISTAEWTGVPLRSILEESGLSDQAYDVVFRAADGFSDSIRVDRAMRGDVIIAHKMNGVPLPAGHGFPARVIVPGHYGMKSVQWLTEIEVVPYDHKGYYQQKGWTEEAIVKTMSRIDVPGHGITVQGLRQKVEGIAFAGLRGISRVELSTDGGDHWIPANVAAPLSPYAWIFWSYDWTVPAPGRHTLIVRATDTAYPRRATVLMLLRGWPPVKNRTSMVIHDPTRRSHMPIITQIICDSCQAVKKETNHWYTLVVDGQYQVCLRPMAHTPASLLQLGASHVSYFCGMRCALDGITQWMDRLTAPPGEVADESLCGASRDTAVEIGGSPGSYRKSL